MVVSIKVVFGDILKYLVGLEQPEPFPELSVKPKNEKKMWTRTWWSFWLSTRDHVGRNKKGPEDTPFVFCGSDGRLSSRNDG